MQKRAYFYWKPVIYVALGVHYLTEPLQLRNCILHARNLRLREVGPSSPYHQVPDLSTSP